MKDINNLIIISALQGRKLVGIIESSRKRFALFQNANGSIQIISENDYLTNNLLKLCKP